jgi:hypothetical protein
MHAAELLIYIAARWNQTQTGLLGTIRPDTTKRKGGECISQDTGQKSKVYRSGSAWEILDCTQKYLSSVKDIHFSRRQRSSGLVDSDKS